MELTDKAFNQIRDFMFRVAGISLSMEKRPLVCGRLARRLGPTGCADYGAYIALVASGSQPEETQRAIDLLTTNETHFFREPAHFDALREYIAARSSAPNRAPGPFRVWSAACSSGEEPYTIAMVLADCLGEQGNWEVLASDLSSRVLEKAQRGQYGPERLPEIPTEYLKRFCLKGVGAQAGSFLIDKPLRSKVSFRQLNLNQKLPELGRFDVIFLRNVMIYFNLETKRQVVARLVERLRRGAWLIVGHSETLQGIHADMQTVQPTIYRRDI